VPPLPDATGDEELSQLREQLQGAEAKLHAMERSRIWRMTAPIRAAARRVRARGH
jgi:hypothetical protein